MFLYYCKSINGFVTAFGPDNQRRSKADFSELFEGFRNKDGLLE